jgi:hypothetical protein
MPKLTKRLIDSLEPQGRDFIVWDDELRDPRYPAH